MCVIKILLKLTLAAAVVYFVVGVVKNVIYIKKEKSTR